MFDNELVRKKVTFEVIICDYISFRRAQIVIRRAQSLQHLRHQLSAHIQGKT